MDISISQKQMDLLREVLKDRQPDMLATVARAALTTLNQKQRQTICEAIAEEIATTGLKDDSEPNQRGLLLEDIIDALRAKPP